MVVARTLVGNHFAKKFGKRPPPGVIVTEVVNINFSEKQLKTSFTTTRENIFKLIKKFIIENT